jgi:hypothetical protein
MTSTTGEVQITTGTITQSELNFFRNLNWEVLNHVEGEATKWFIQSGISRYDLDSYFRNSDEDLVIFEKEDLPPLVIPWESKVEFEVKLKSTPKT